MRVAFLGTGLMGSRMARNILSAGHILFVYNRTREKAEALVSEGARMLESPAEIGDRADAVVTMLADPSAVEETALGSAGFLRSAAAGTLWIDCSTVDPSFSRKMAGIADEHGLRFIDAPVAGTTGPAERGELVILAGGDARDIEEAAPVFDAVGRKTIHVGENGKGTSMKLVVNTMIAQSMVSFCESVNFGKAMGIPEELLFDTLLGGPMTAPYLSNKRGKFETDTYETEFPLELMHKDLGLTGATAGQVGMPMPSAAEAREIFQMAKANGLGGEDFSAVYRLYARMIAQLQQTDE